MSDAQAESRDIRLDQEQVEVNKNRLKVKIYSPIHTYFDKYADSVSASNKTGPFDILPKHHNFITLLNEGDIVIRSDDDEREQTVKISGGMLRVHDNIVTVFLDV